MKKVVLIIFSVCLLAVLSGCELSGTSDNGDNNIDTGSTKSVLSNLNNSSNSSQANDNSTFFKETKEYLLGSQGNVAEAERLHWVESFLNKVDFDKMYQEYIKADGDKSNVAKFAKFVTENAVEPDNWKDLFTNELNKSYGKIPTGYEDIGNGLYQVYVEEDGKSVPFVTVNSRTGWFHG